ncbi:methylmalonyl-CoA mutase family protein [Mycolicibacterium novocastrense]|nr:methylmalonyl-CoA mutase family protein [Mycolicibacterium novocastrense]
MRGGDALRDVKAGWKVAEAFPANGPGNVAEHNGAVLLSLTEGVSALVIRVGAPAGVAAAELDRLFDGVFLDLVPVLFEIAGPDYVRVADAVLGLLSDLDDDQRSRLSVDLGADPLTAPLSGRVAPRNRRRRGHRCQTRRLTAAAFAPSPSTDPAFHNLGANASWELAGLVSAGVSHLRQLEEGGVGVADALRQIRGASRFCL